ncbi:MAG: hypothetical protein FWF83_03905 [Clostridiales bacterium]|nr:hypothetical protein [Clostridiales bacterium]
MSEPAKELIDYAVDLDSRAVSARDSKEDTERLIADFKTFLRSRVLRYSNGRDSAQVEEMQGTAMMALYESLQKYDASKGHFFPFANRVVCGRLIDYSRKAQRQDVYTVSLEDDDEEQQSAQSAAVNEISIRLYEAERAKEQMADEIRQFTTELHDWGITMDTLVAQSPKHAKLREEYKRAVTIIANQEDILQTIQLKRYFPIKAIAKITGLPQKKLERARSFILASLIIKIGSYDYLSEYING